MSNQENKECLRRLLDAPNKGDFSMVDKIVSEDFVYRSSMGEEYHGRDGFQELVSTYRQAFPDLELVPEEMIGEGDVVYAKVDQHGTHQGPLMNLEPTGKKVSLPMLCRFRFEDGQLVELYESFDSMALMRQLGVGQEDVGAERGRQASPPRDGRSQPRP